MKRETFITLKASKMMAESVGQLLQQAGYTNSGNFNDSEIAIQETINQCPDYFITQSELTGAKGYEVIRRIKTAIKIDCIIAIVNQESYSQDEYETNISGYLSLNHFDISELLNCLKVIKSGKRYISSHLESPFGTNSIQTIGLLKRLTSRERDILKKMKDGPENAELASRLCISENTLSSHLSHLKSKLNCNSSRQLIVLAAQAAHLL